MAVTRKARWASFYEKTRTHKRRVQESSPLTWAWYSAKSRSKKRGVQFSITVADLPLHEFCPVLGVRLEYNTGKRGPNSPSLDRIDPAKGYVPGNVDVISFRANCIKNNATLDEVRAVVRYIEERLPDAIRRQQDQDPTMLVTSSARSRADS
jgi:hypothetical protein